MAISPHLGRCCLLFPPLVVLVLVLLDAKSCHAQVTPQPEPATPHIQAGWNTTNLFWPGETDAISNVTYACTYTGYVVLAEDRLVAFGGCSANPKSCNGYHVSSSLSSLPTLSSSSTSSLPKSTCMKYSDDAGRTWTQIRMVRTEAGEGFAAGGLVYDRVAKKIITQFQQNGSIVQTTSSDKGKTWTKLVNISAFLGDGFPVPVPGVVGSAMMWKRN